MKDSERNDYEQRLSVLEIGLAGCHGCFAEGNSRITMYDPRIRAYFGEVVEGGYVLIKTDVLDKNPGLAYRSPMVQGNLKEGERDEFQGGADPFMMAALSDAASFGAIALMAAVAPKCGAFDFVAPDVYADWWRPHGVQIGRRRGSRIEWENGDSEAIRPFASRWIGD